MNWNSIALGILLIFLWNGLVGWLLYLVWRGLLRFFRSRMDIQVTYILLRLIVLMLLVPLVGVIQLLIGIHNGYYLVLSELMGMWSIRCIMLLGILWFAVSVYRLVRLARSRKQVKRLIRMGSFPADKDWLNSLEEVKGELEYYGSVEIRTQMTEPSAFVMGVLSPVIYVPAHPVTEMERQVILTHEISHIQERDLLWKVFGAVGRCLYWPLPIFRYIERDLHDWSEFNCDYIASGKIGSARCYFDIIESLITASCRWQGSVWLSLLGENESELKKRILRMVHQQRISHRRVHFILWAAACFLTLGTTTASAASYTTMLEIHQRYFDTMDIVYEENDGDLWLIEDQHCKRQQDLSIELCGPGQWNLQNHSSFLEGDLHTGIIFHWIIPAGCAFVSAYDFYEPKGTYGIVVDATIETEGAAAQVGLISRSGDIIYVEYEDVGYGYFESLERGEYAVFVENRSDQMLDIGGYAMIEQP